VAAVTSILAIDPGTRETGFVLFDGKRVAYSGVKPNDEVLRMLAGWRDTSTRLATEIFQSMGMAVGQEVFETCIWIGRFVQAWHTPADVMRIKRTQVKLHLCGNARAKDPNIRQALLDAVGPPGNKHDPGPTFGVKSHAWSALGVAVTAQALLGVGLHGTMFHEKPAQQSAEAGAF
jgi:hypothetical protein